MRYRTLLFALLAAGLLSCVDLLDQTLPSSTAVLVVDGSITDQTEPQRAIQLSRAYPDPLSGFFGITLMTKARVEIIVDSAVVIACPETIEGNYQPPNDFRGRIGHAYQLRFTLADGTRYASDQQVMPPVPPIARLTAEFAGGVHNIYLDTQDPAGQTNYYQWQWRDYERQYWCKTCNQGVYAVNNILPHVYKDELYFVSGTDVYEDCFTPPVGRIEKGAPSVANGRFFYDYPCRGQCWQILYGKELNIFADVLSNGGLIGRRKVAEIPYYTHDPCLVGIQQLSLTPAAYRYTKLVQDQTQNTGGVADTAPSAPIGNIRNLTNDREPVVGFFAASAITEARYWLNRKDATGVPLGALNPAGPSPEFAGTELFWVLYARSVSPEPPPPYFGNGPRPVPAILIYGGPQRPPTALCTPSNTRTPVKPLGWRD